LALYPCQFDANRGHFEAGGSDVGRFAPKGRRRREVLTFPDNYDGLQYRYYGLQSRSDERAGLPPSRRTAIVLSMKA
jgi:hypothetical protein